MARRVLLAFALAAIAALGAAACSARVGDVDDGLNYSVVPHSGGITATVTDERGDERTVWLIVSDSRGRELSVLTSYGAGGDDPRVTEMGSAEMELDPGTYRYAVYDAPGELSADAAEYWTAEHRLASGEVEVE